MNKLIVLLSLIIVVRSGISQETIESTSQFTVFGLVEAAVTITFADLEKQKTTDLGNFQVTNHLGEFKKEYKNVKGVPLLSLLNNVKITASSPKLLSEYYLVFKASDDYSVVVSWNELFNTEIGNSFFLVVEADSKSQKDAPEKILLISTKDFKTGRRHVKGLKSIEVKRI
ncbi:MAG: molybdopterin-binding protein [Saprospiraceae bacterium]